MRGPRGEAEEEETGEEEWHPGKGDVKYYYVALSRVNVPWLHATVLGGNSWAALGGMSIHWLQSTVLGGACGSSF